MTCFDYMDDLMDNDHINDMSEESAAVEPPAPETLPDAKAVIEALMIATTEPLPLRSIAEIAHVPEPAARTIIAELNAEYRASSRAFEIKEIAGGFQIYTLPVFAEWVGALHKRKERLSKAALETLAIVAYHQPIIRADIENIRGVDATSVLDTLLQKNLIKTCGRLASPGRPIKYTTTKEFLRYFGIKDLSELPKEEDFGEHAIGRYLESSRTPDAGAPGSEDPGPAREDRSDVVDLSEDDATSPRPVSDFTPDDGVLQDGRAEPDGDDEPVDRTVDAGPPDEDPPLPVD